MGAAIGLWFGLLLLGTRSEPVATAAEQTPVVVVATMPPEQLRAILAAEAAGAVRGPMATAATDAVPKAVDLVEANARLLVRDLAATAVAEAYNKMHPTPAMPPDPPLTGR